MPSPELLSERITVLFHKQSSRHAFNRFHYVWDEVLRGTVYENMYMVFVCVEFQNFEVIVIGYFSSIEARSSTISGVSTSCLCFTHQTIW